MIKEIHIYPEKKSNGRLLERIVFKFPLLNEIVDFSMDNEDSLENVVLLSKKNVKPKDCVEIGVDIEDYNKIKEGK